nr:hypothetical protein [Tanacetum cinerariifolium]
MIKKCSNPTSAISDETIANPNAQIVRDDMVRVQVPRDVPSFDGPEPQPLLNSPSLDVSLREVIGPEPPIKPHSPDTSRMKVVDYLITQTPPSPHVANSHPKGVYSYYNPGRFDVFFRDQLLVFQQHPDESLYDSWTRFKDVIQKVPNHGLSIWTLIEIFLKHLDSLSRHIINLIAEWGLKKFSGIGS